MSARINIFFCFVVIVPLYASCSGISLSFPNQESFVSYCKTYIEKDDMQMLQIAGDQEPAYKNNKEIGFLLLQTALQGGSFRSSYSLCVKEWGIDFNQRGLSNRTLLMKLVTTSLKDSECTWCAWDLVYFLSGKSPFFKDDPLLLEECEKVKGNTALLCACRSFIYTKSWAIVPLLKAGANVHARNKKGETPLMALLHRIKSENAQSSLGLLQALLRAGARVDECDNNGKSVMEYARNTQHPSVSRLIGQALIEGPSLCMS